MLELRPNAGLHQRATGDMNSRLYDLNQRQRPIARSAEISLIAQCRVSDPSALKKARFPLLIAEIQKYVEGHAEQRPPSVRQVSLLARRKNRGLRERIEEITQQRDHLASLLGEADATILELYDRIADLERHLPASNVLPLDPRGHKKL